MRTMPGQSLLIIVLLCEILNLAYQHLLEEIVHLVLVVGEHVSHRVYGASLPPYEICKCLFVMFHFVRFLRALHSLDAVGAMKTTRLCKKKWTSLLRHARMSILCVLFWVVSQSLAFLQP